MNKFTESESKAAHQLHLDASALKLSAGIRAGEYASPEDRDAATIALLLKALELAGGASFIKQKEE